MTQLSGFLSYPFMVHALIVGLLVSVCCALLGVSLVLRRYSMIGDGLSHVGFGALAIATVAGMAPLALAIPVVVLSAFVLLRISEKEQNQGGCGYRADFDGSFSYRRNGRFHEQRHQYGDFELYVRKYSGAVAFRCGTERHSGCHRSSVFHLFLPQNLCGHL